MKKALTFFGAILFASAILTSCGGSSEKKAETPAPAKPKDEQTSTPSTNPSSSTTPSSDEPSSDPRSKRMRNEKCLQFCEDYEKFVDSYIAVLKKQKANPTDASVIAEYSQMMSKATAMQEDSQACTGNPEFAARIAKAAAKMAAAASAM